MSCYSSTNDPIGRTKLWPDVISKFDLTHGETMYGLEEALDAIYKHQHPVDCKNSKFLISGMFESGFGSEQHVIGVGLATAMNLNRVYIMWPDRKFESGTRNCCHFCICACSWSIHIYITYIRFIHTYIHTYMQTCIFIEVCVHKHMN